jgi:hypothetical protein
MLVLPSGVLVVFGGGVVFVLGFAAGMAVFSKVLAERERQLSRERRAVNEVWRRVYRLTGVQRPVWMTDFRDRDTTDAASGGESCDKN